MDRKQKHKQCTKCKEIKSVRAFYKRGDGYRTQCKQCENNYSKQSYQRDTEYHKERSRIWKENHKEHTREKAKEYYYNNQDKIQKYKDNNKEIIAERKRRWRENNSDYNKQYYEAHKEEINKQKLAYNKHKRATDPVWKIRNNLRTRLYHALKGQAKNGSAVRDMGCTVEELKLYLESKWQEGMNWSNYGRYGWHIDHIAPLASFDLTNREELLKACHYTNLQPLWEIDNIKKGKR